MVNPPDKPQIEKFRDASRELKIDQTDAVFEAVVNKVAKAPKLTAEAIKEFARRQRDKATK